MTHVRTLFPGLLLSLALLGGCGDGGSTERVVPRGARLLGISLSDRADGDFGTAYAQANAAGMQVTSLSQGWDELETAPGIYAPDPDFLGIAASFYAPRGTRLVLGINPIDTNNRRVPAHLEGRAWDDEAVVDAFKDLLDWALPKVAALDLVALSIGNEIDGTLSSPEEWAAYQRFWIAVAAHARTLRPGLRVSTKITSNGLRSQPEALAIHVHTDCVLTTYYPLESDFTVAPLDHVGALFDELTKRFEGRPLLFAEIGAPSSTSCESSPAKQAAFVEACFRAWDRHAAQVELLEFTWMHDISAEAVATYEAYYGVSDPCFLAYLGTLGLKGPDGTDNPAWATLVREASLRGW